MIQQNNNEEEIKDDIKKNIFVRKCDRLENKYEKADFDEVVLSFNHLIFNFKIDDNNIKTEYIVITTTNKDIFKNDVRTTIKKINKKDNIKMFLHKNKILRKNLKYIVKRIWTNNFIVKHIYFRII